MVVGTWDAQRTSAGTDAVTPAGRQMGRQAGRQHRQPLQLPLLTSRHVYGIEPSDVCACHGVKGQAEGHQVGCGTAGGGS